MRPAPSLLPPPTPAAHPSPQAPSSRDSPGTGTGWVLRMDPQHTSYSRPTSSGLASLGSILLKNSGIYSLNNYSALQAEEHMTHFFPLSLKCQKMCTVHKNSFSCQKVPPAFSQCDEISGERWNCTNFVSATRFPF